MFRSADLATLTASGELALIGRADDLINVGGKKVHLPRDRDRAARDAGSARGASSSAFRRRATSAPVVRAFIACDPASISYAAVATWCRERLAGHKVPRSIVRLPEIPQNRARQGRSRRARRLDAGLKRDEPLAVPPGIGRDCTRRRFPRWRLAPHRWPWIAAALIANHYVTIAGGLCREARFWARTSVARPRPGRRGRSCSPSTTAPTRT